MNQTWHRHLGVYGLCLDETRERLLVIHKTAGPYRGRYDLPGGSIDPQESLIEAVHREFLEETGLNIHVLRALGTYDFLVRYAFRETAYTHHIAVFYEVGLDRQDRGALVSQWLNKPFGEEANDSRGIEWVPLMNFTEANTSPLIRKALCWLREGVLSPEMEHYEDWEAR